MNTYEYSIDGSQADCFGLASLPAICTQIMDALERSVDRECGIRTHDNSEPARLVMTSSALEIDERPKVDDFYNVSIVHDDQEDGDWLIRLTDYDGHEMGRGISKWSLTEENGACPPASPRDGSSYLDMFCKMIPKETLCSGLSFRIGMDFFGMPLKGEKISRKISKEGDEKYIFIAQTADRTLCEASLFTE